MSRGTDRISRVDNMGDIDAQRVMEQLHRKWARALRAEAEGRARSVDQGSARDGGALGPALAPELAPILSSGSLPDPATARRAVARSAAIIDQKDRARAIAARVVRGGRREASATRFATKAMLAAIERAKS